MIDTTKEFATDVEPSTQSRQMDDITDALEMEIMSAIADEEKQSGSSNMVRLPFTPATSIAERLCYAVSRLDVEGYVYL